MTAALDADVVVVGLGGMGSQALWRLARRGARVLGVDQFPPGHDRGSSHGQTRIIRTAYAEGPDYVPLVQHAWRLWDELAATTGADLLRRTGGLMLGPPAAATIAGPLASARRHGLPYQLLDAAQVRARFPQHRFGTGAGFLEADAGVLFPERSVRAAVRAAVAAGASTAIGSPVTAVRPDPDRPLVRIGDRILTARHVVVAAGAWTARLLTGPPPGTELAGTAGQRDGPRQPESPGRAGLAARLRPVRRVVGWFAADRPDDFAPDRFPCYIRADGDQPGSSVWYGCPHVDGRTVKIGLHVRPGLDEPVDPVRGPRPPGPADAAALTDIVAATLVGLRPDPVRLAACMYTLTPDEHFVLGAHRDLPGLTLLAGFSGHGFKFAPVVGEIAAQLALTGTSTLPITLFDPQRFD
jgi:sarcosine oxidase